MPIDPSLITDTLSRWQSPQFAMPDPLAQFAKLQALKNGIMQQQSDALDLQQKQQQIAGQKALDDAITNAYTRSPDGSLELNTDAVTNGLAQKGFGHLVPGVLKNFTDMKESAAKAQTAQLAAKNATNDYTASALATVYDSGYDPHVAIGALAHAVDSGIVPAPQAAALTAQIQQNPTPDGVKQAFAPLFAASPGFQERIQKQQTADAATTRAGAAKTEADVATAKEQRQKDQDFVNAVGGAQSQQDLDAMRAQAAAKGVSPATISATPGAYSPEAVKQFAEKTLTTKDREELAQRALDAKNQEADRQVTQGQRAQDIAIARSRLGVEQQRLKAETAVAGPFVGLPPQERAKAENAYDKDTKDYTDKISSARGLQDMIAQAQGGNKAAPALIPIAELRQFVNRVNSAELQSVGVNAGSVVDKIQGYIDGKTAGQPIPPALLTDMLAVSKGQEKAANRGYLGRLAANKAAFGASPPPIDIESVYNGGTAPAAPGLKVGDPVTLKGKPATVTAVHPDGSFDADFKK